jgi:hypothetical protein
MTGQPRVHKGVLAQANSRSCTLLASYTQLSHIVRQPTTNLIVHSHTGGQPRHQNSTPAAAAAAAFGAAPTAYHGVATTQLLQLLLTVTKCDCFHTVAASKPMAELMEDLTASYTAKQTALAGKLLASAGAKPL